MKPTACSFWIALAVLISLVGLAPAQSPQVGQAEVKIGGQAAVASSPSAFGFLLLHRGEATQVALMGRSPSMLVSVSEAMAVRCAKS